MTDLTVLEPTRDEVRPVHRERPAQPTPTPATATATPTAPSVGALALSSVGRWCANRFRQYQHAKITSVMHKLSDKQLAAVGITRAEIPDHVRRLVYGK